MPHAPRTPQMLQIPHRLSKAVCTFAAMCLAPAVMAAPDVDRVERSIVRVVVGGHGTGWVVSPEIVATNWHVAEGTDTFEIIPAGTSDAYSGSVLWIGNQDLDIALLSVPGLPLDPLPIHTAAVPRGSPSYTTGFPGLGDNVTGRANLNVSVYGGTIALEVETTAGVRVIQHTNIVNAGNSGGPLLDECGRVLGLTTWGFENEDISADFIWASMNVAELADQMDRLGIPYTTDNSPCLANSGGAAPVDISGTVSDAVNAAMGAAVDAATSAASTAAQAAQAAEQSSVARETANEQRFSAMTRQLYGWGGGMGAALALVLAVALRRPRQQILQAVESVSRVIRRSSGSAGAHREGGGRASAMPQGLILSGSGTNGTMVSFPLEPAALADQGISLGRDPALVDFSVEDDLVSRRHTRFIWADGKVQIEDLNSTNGTFVNGRQLNAFAPGSLHVGDIVRIGNLTLAVSLLSR